MRNMKYKCKSSQVFRKKLPVPKEIRDLVYQNYLSFSDFLKYDLEDKIPISCLKKEDREVVERFGIVRAKELDWELLNKNLGFTNYKLYEILEKISLEEPDINRAFYEIAQEFVAPKDYTSRMKSYFNGRFIDIAEIHDEELMQLAQRFNDGIISLEEILAHWEFFEDKDTYYCLNQNRYSELSHQILKNFMNDYGNLASLFIKLDGLVYYIYQYARIRDKKERDASFTRVTDTILRNGFIWESTKDYLLTDEDYKVLFKYSSVSNFLHNLLKNSNLYEEMKDMTAEELLSLPFSLNELRNVNVVKFLEEYGLHNVVDFENNCGHFFTQNDCFMLRNIYPLYMEYGFTKDENTTLIKSHQNGYTPYSREEFYEFVRKIIIYGPTKKTNEKVYVDYRDISGEFRKLYENLFLREDAPIDLKDAFYNRRVDVEYLFKHEEYHSYLKHIDIEYFCPYIPVFAYNKTFINLLYWIKILFDKDEAFDLLLSYGKYFPFIRHVEYSQSFTKEQLFCILEEELRYYAIKDGAFYNDKCPYSFRRQYPSFFLALDAPQELKNLFYGKKLTLSHFDADSGLLDKIGQANVAYGLDRTFLWVADLSYDAKDEREKNYYRIKTIRTFLKIEDAEMQKKYKDIVCKYNCYIESENLDLALDVIQKLNSSNSKEMFKFRVVLAEQILKTEDPLASLNLIENIFVRNNLPVVGKIFLCFQILHPDFDGMDLDSSKVSPILDKASLHSKRVIIFSDLLKASLGSNNRSLLAYINNILYGTALFEQLRKKQIQMQDLSIEEMREFHIFAGHLITLYNNAQKSKNHTFVTSGNAFDDITNLYTLLALNKDTEYSLANRIINMFCHFAGFKDAESILFYVNSKIAEADKRNRIMAEKRFELEKGDFIKGVQKTFNIGSILQNGCVSKEYLGVEAGSDNTPLDTDIAIISQSDGDNLTKIEHTAARNYGDLYLVLKNDDRFIMTRDWKQTNDGKMDLSKLEVFYTGCVGDTHYGIRTGFASSDINCILMRDYNPIVGLEIAMNGFYIPVANLNGEIVFTPRDYDDLRRKMQGLSYYNENTYLFSNYLLTHDIKEIVSQLQKNSDEVAVKKGSILKRICSALDEFGLQVKFYIDGNLQEGVAEVIDTGSTGRGTNVPKDGDFDFIMRLDRVLLEDKEQFKKVKEQILKQFPIYRELLSIEDDSLKMRGVQIAADTLVDIDITFSLKTNNVSYSTDMAISDRLATIRKEDEEKYNYVLANIILAKQVLKDAKVYKAHKSDQAQGGLGGVGIENWILQHGGSFLEAAMSFVRASEGKNFREFKNNYFVWDFGENHLAEKRELYAHDNFVNNMSASGYEKMCLVLMKYIETYEQMKKQAVGRKT